MIIESVGLSQEPFSSGLIYKLWTWLYKKRLYFLCASFTVRYSQIILSSGRKKKRMWEEFERLLDLYRGTKSINAHIVIRSGVAALDRQLTPVPRPWRAQQQDRGRLDFWHYASGNHIAPDNIPLMVFTRETHTPSS